MAKTIEVIGMDEINRFLDEIPDKILAFKFVQDTYAEVLKMGVVKEAQRLAPVGTKEVISRQYASRTHKPGNLKRSIGVVRGKSKKYPSVYAGPKSRNVFGKGASSYDGWYAHMIEFGHAGRDGKPIPPKPFMRPAWDIWKGRTMDLVALGYTKQLIRATKRLQRKLNK